MKRTILALAILLWPVLQWAQQADFHVIPLPLSVQTDSTQTFTLTSGMGIGYDASQPEQGRIASWLRQFIEETSGVNLLLQPNNKKAAVYLSIKAGAKGKTAKAGGKGAAQAQVATTPADPRVEGSTPQQEAYTISISRRGITISAAAPVGLYRAAQTIRKAMPLQAKGSAKVVLPTGSIQDQPRFVYRGMHFDCSRHYFDLPTVKRYIDQLALHGCNKLHWHITDDQGWRFEVKALPELAKKGSVRKCTVLGQNSGVYDNVSYGGYYTQAECREIVNYAAERYITVIPEIDLPGHMLAALSVYPNLGCTGGPYEVWPMWGVAEDVLCAGNPDVISFLKTVLGELCDVFPSKYIHIGGDESPRVRWEHCPKCQAKIKELGLQPVMGPNGKVRMSAEQQLQTYINHEMEAFLASRGRNLIGWDEILEGGLTPEATVMSWRGTEGGIAAARQHHHVIMSPNSHCYIDHYQLKDQRKQLLGIGGYLPVSKVYSFEPLPQELTAEEQAYILGPQCNLWTEYVAYPQHVFYMLLPRLDALSEVQWTPASQKDYASFCQRLPHMLSLYDRLGFNYCPTIE